MPRAGPPAPSKGSTHDRHAPAAGAPTPATPPAARLPRPEAAPQPARRDHRLALRPADRALRDPPVRAAAAARAADVGLGLAAARRQPGLELPRELPGGGVEPVLLGLDPVHPEVHGAHHDHPARAEPRARPARAGVDALEGPAAHVVPRAERPRPGIRLAALLRALLADRRPVRRPHGVVGLHVPRHPRRRAVVDDLPHRLALRGLLHAAHARGPAGHPRRRLRGRAHRRRARAGRRSAA